MEPAKIGGKVHISDTGALTLVTAPTTPSTSAAADSATLADLKTRVDALRAKIGECSDNHDFTITCAHDEITDVLKE